MDSMGAVYLTEILSNADIFMLIFARMIGFIAIVPIIGGRNVPLMARVGFSIALASIIYSTGQITNIFYYDNIIGYGFLIAKEFFVGYIIGFVAVFIINVTYLAGFYTDQQIGFSMANVFDPITQTQVPITGNLYYFMISVIIIISNTHHMFIKMLFYSYKALPIGNALLIGNQKLFYVMLELMERFFVIGVSIAIPIIGVILVMDLVLGILVRTVPQINVFVVGMPIKVLVGIFTIWIILPMFTNVYHFIYNAFTQYMLSVIGVMIP